MELSLQELYEIKNILIKEGLQSEDLFNIVLNDIESKEISEDTSATGGPAVSGGMGAVVSAQPSGLAGATIGTNWASGGGTTGSLSSISSISSSLAGAGTTTVGILRPRPRPRTRPRPWCGLTSQPHSQTIF
jgi:hypothetical protein